MKKQLLLAGAFAMITAVSFAQQKETQKREIKKEVEMTEENGQKKLVIKTDDNGKVTEEVFVGEAADKKLEEIKGEHQNLTSDQETVEVKMEEVNGEKKLTVTKSSGDKKKEKVYYGEEAEMKLKELEGKKPVGNVEKKVKMQRKMKVQQKKTN
ncbi:MAG: hypothetical protein ACO2Z9_08180 [Crocinitomicaceae bacterium]